MVKQKQENEKLIAAQNYNQKQYIKMKNNKKRKNNIIERRQQAEQKKIALKKMQQKQKEMHNMSKKDSTYKNAWIPESQPEQQDEKLEGNQRIILIQMQQNTQILIIVMNKNFGHIIC
ncbi:unnamed protein product [Paramecium sonneborni]|uniref:Uncharacterized protein n=1 Tax=Paramecium sonneborni TaxID=65129 RepID=A0A8S1MUT4_9CILI|nr:unnamed protein product [Paramecium sonneborni]